VSAAAAYPVVPVFHLRRDARRALKLGYPRGAGRVRLCRTIQAVERLLHQRLVDAVVLDVRHLDGDGLALPARFPRIPMYALSAVRPDDGALLPAGTPGSKTY
jgi:DNA-binding NtrC family response regulator